VLFEAGTIPAGSTLELRLEGLIGADLLAQVERWIAESPARGQAVWAADRVKPLRWSGDETGSSISWALSPLASHIIWEATGERRDAIAGGNVWYFQNRSVSEWAIAVEAGEE
jgi:hypothetical protein